MTEHHRREDFNGFDKHDIEVEHRIAALEANYANLDASVSRVGKAAKEAAEGVVLLRTEIQSLLAPLVERATISKASSPSFRQRKRTGHFGTTRISLCRTIIRPT